MDEARPISVCWRSDENRPFGSNLLTLFKSEKSKKKFSFTQFKSTNDERVLFSIMASPALPIVNPFKTAEAEDLYNKYYEEGNVLRVK